MLSKSQLQRMALQWARTYRPALLEDLGPDGAQAWATERAAAVMEQYNEIRVPIETSNQTAQQMQTQLRARWEELLADHFPVTSEELDASSLPKEATRRLEVKQAQFRAAKQAEGLDPEEIAEIWTEIEPMHRRAILEDLEREEFDR